MPDDRGELLGQLHLRERAQVDALDAPGAHELGQQRAQRVRAADVVDAIGPDDQDALALEVAHEEADQVARRGIGPVEVLQDQHDRGLLGDAREHLEHELEQPRTSGGRVAGGLLVGPEVGHQPGHLRPCGGRDPAVAQLRLRRAQHAPQSLGERRERQPAGDVHAAAERRNGPVRAGAGRELLDQARLADSRLPGDQDHPARPGGDRGERRREALELLGPADEARAADAHPTGISARTTVPPPTGLSTCEPPVERRDAVGDPAQAGARPRVGAADAVVAHLDHAARPFTRATRDLGGGRLRRTWRRSSAPRRRRSRRRSRPAAAAAPPARRRPSPARARARRAPSSAGAEPALGQHRRVDAARELAQLRQADASSSSSARVEQRRPSGSSSSRLRGEPQRERERDEALLRAVVEVALDPPARGVAGLDEPRARRAQLLERARSSASRRSFSSASAGGRAGARAPARGSSSSAASWTIAATGRPSRSISRHRAAAPGSGSSHRRPGGVDVAAVGRAASRRARASGRRAPRPARRATPSRGGRALDQRADRARAREAGAQQARRGTRTAPRSEATISGQSTAFDRLLGAEAGAGSRSSNPSAPIAAPVHRTGESARRWTFPEARQRLEEHDER